MTGMWKRVLAIAVAGGAVVFVSAAAGASQTRVPRQSGGDNESSTEATVPAPFNAEGSVAPAPAVTSQSGAHESATEMSDSTGPEAEKPLAGSPSGGRADDKLTSGTTNTSPPGSAEEYWTEERRRDTPPMPLPTFQ